MMRALLLILTVFWSALVKAGPFDAPSRTDQLRTYSSAETNPYPPPALVPCRYCPVTIEFYTAHLTADVMRDIGAFLANPLIKNARGMEVGYFLVLGSGHRFSAKGGTEAGPWPKGVVFRPDPKAKQATARGVKTFPTFYVKTPNETWLVLPHDINTALDQIYR